MNAKELGAMPFASVHGQCHRHIETGVPLDPFNGHGWMIEPQPGITLRQHFAGLAMQGFLANFAHGHEALNVDGLAVVAVRQADALLAELAKDQP